MNKALIPITLTALLTATGAAGLTDTVEASRPEHRRVEVTHGRFETLPGGTEHGYEIRGGAIMIRTNAGGGSTFVAVGVRGLEPDTTYKTHVHNQPCSAPTPGGGHYQHEIGGAVDATNEIWPTLTTDSNGRAIGTALHGARARDDARAIVIHWPDDPAVRLACLDLG